MLTSKPINPAAAITNHQAALAALQLAARHAASCAHHALVTNLIARETLTTHPDAAAQLSDAPAALHEQLAITTTLVREWAEDLSLSSTAFLDTTNNLARLLHPDRPPPNSAHADPLRGTHHLINAALLYTGAPPLDPSETAALTADLATADET